MRMTATRAASFLLVLFLLITPLTSHADATTTIQAYAWSGSMAGRQHMFNVYVTNSVYTPTQVAAQLNVLPAGSRTLLMIGFEDNNIFSNNNKYKGVAGLTYNPLDKTKDAQGNFTGYTSPWLDNGTADLQARVQLWMDDFVAAGGNLDRVEFDYEGGLSTWSGLTFAQMRAIIADPRSAALEAEMAPWHLADALSTVPAKMRFNALMAQRLAQAMQTAEFDVVKSYFPNVTGSSYNHTLVTETEVFNVVQDLNGNPQYGYEIVGTDNTWPFYGWMNQLRNLVLPGLTSPYGADAYKALRWNVKMIRGMRRSAPAIPVRPWIGYKGWTSDTVGTIHIGNTPYYDELIYHLALNGADDFLYFAPEPPYGVATVTDHIYLDNLLEELRGRDVLKTATTTTLEDIAWDSDVVASGMQVSDTSVLWRITASSSESTVNVIKNGLVAEQLTIPGGSAGVWYTTNVGEQVSFVLPSTDHTNQPPTVSVSTPATSEPDVNVSPAPNATASDSDGSVASVTFCYTNELGCTTTDSAFPYTLFHTLPVAGPYHLFAVAKDNDGATTISASSTVTILAYAPAVTTDTTTPRSPQTINANGTVTSINGTAVITRGFQYGLTTAYGSSVEIDSIVSTGAFSLGITGLRCATQYHVRAFATNAIGTGYGTDQAVTTPSCQTFRLIRGFLHRVGGYLRIGGAQP